MICKRCTCLLYTVLCIIAYSILPVMYSFIIFTFSLKFEVELTRNLLL